MRTVRRFVALDVETTGLDPAKDELIEVGAVRFDGDAPVAVFTRFCRPSRSRGWQDGGAGALPLVVRRLTGIEPEMIASAPPAGEVAAALRAFVGDAPIVAHNAAFDLSFLLGRHGWPQHLPNPVYDTWPLARVVLPLAGSYRLEDLARLLGVPVTTTHRAAHDAELAGRVFTALWTRLQARPVELLVELERLARPLADGMHHVISTAAIAAASRFDRQGTYMPVQPEKQAEAHAPAAQAATQAAQAAEPADAILDAARLLGADGPLARSLTAYEHRPGQVQMAQRVAEALEQGRHLLVEAGTGVGKSMAYLIPALLWARQTRQRVVVSTGTINLQEQLWEKDLPLLRQALGVPFEAALVKGRSNYLCIRKWRREIDEGQAFWAEPERRFFLRLSAWAQETETGDRAELGLLPEEERAWSAVASETETCLGPRCPWYARHCFYFRAKRRAERAQLLVANHSLVLADLKACRNLLPEYGALIIDEAHALEDVATEHLGVHLTPGEVTRALQQVLRSGEGPPGLLAKVRQQLGSEALLREQYPDVAQLVPEIGARAREARATAERLFFLAAQLAGEHTLREEEGEAAVRLDPLVRSHPFWGELIASRDELVPQLLTLAQQVARLGESLTSLGAVHGLSIEAVAADAARVAAQLADCAQAIAHVLAVPDADQDGEEDVRWLEWIGGAGGLRTIALRSAPVDVGKQLRELLWEPLGRSVLASATLTSGGTFQHVRSRLGLQHLPSERVQEAVVPSPFPYRDQVLLCLPSDMPSPKDTGEREMVAALRTALRDLLLTTGGRALVLFTSHRLLRQVYFALKPDLEAADICLLGQGIDGSRARLAEQLKRGERTAVFGAASFWEGVDVPGEALSCVVMVRLPFRPPNHPVAAARAERLEQRGIGAFGALALPQAILRFKQGFGRLVRTGRDRGVVVVLDPRLQPTARGYARQFLQALPPVQVLHAPLSDLLRPIGRWLDGHAKTNDKETHG